MSNTIPVEHDDPRQKLRCPRCKGKGTLYGYELNQAEPDLPYNCPVCSGTGYVLDKKGDR